MSFSGSSPVNSFAVKELQIRKFQRINQCPNSLILERKRKREQSENKKKKGENIEQSLHVDKLHKVGIDGPRETVSLQTPAAQLC